MTRTALAKSLLALILVVLLFLATLGVSLGAPAVAIFRECCRRGRPAYSISTVEDINGRPVDYERLHYRGDLVRFVTRLVRKPSIARSKVACCGLC